MNIRLCSRLSQVQACLSIAVLTANGVAGRPKAALLFWLFSDIRCGVPSFIVILVISKYKNR